MSGELRAEQVRQWFHYNPETGDLTWRVSRGPIKAGQSAGTLKANGSIHVFVARRSYLAHRIAWLYVTGAWPPALLDHVDGNPTNNRIANLRLATHAQNQHNRGKYKNNSSGFKGVRLHKKTGKYEARIRVNNKLINLGLFANPAEAHAVYCVAAETYHGDFRRTT